MIDEHFIDCVKQGKQTIMPYADGLKTLEITLAANKSAETGKKVTLPLS